MIPLGFRCIVPPHLVPFPTLYKHKERIQSTPFEVMLEPPVLLVCLAYVVRHHKNSILILIYNLASKTNPWYPILLGKCFLRLVLHRVHGSSEVGNVLYGQLRLPGPSSSYFHSLKEHAQLELILMKITSPVLIWMLFTCGVLPQLVKPSFLLGITFEICIAYQTWLIRCHLLFFLSRKTSNCFFW